MHTRAWSSLCQSLFRCVCVHLWGYCLDNFRASVQTVYVYVAVLSTLNCCVLGYRLSDRQVSAVLRGISLRINNKTSCQTALFDVWERPHLMKFLTPVTPLRWQRWSAGYCLSIVLCSCARMIDYLGFWGRFWVMCSDSGEQGCSIKFHQMDNCSVYSPCTSMSKMKQEKNILDCFFSFKICVIFTILTCINCTLSMWNQHNTTKIMFILWDGFLNSVKKEGEKLYPSHGPTADYSLTLLRCVHLSVALKWYKAMAGGFENGLIEQLWFYRLCHALS